MKQNMKQGNRSTLIRRAVSTLLAASMLGTCIINYEMVDELERIGTFVAYADQNTWTFNCIEDFVSYSQIYASGGHNTDTLIFAINPSLSPSGISQQGENETDEEFNARVAVYKEQYPVSAYVPLGSTEDTAFSGKIEYSGLADRSAIELNDQPIFYYLSDSADITVNTGTSYVKIARLEDGTEPMLARHIVHDGAYETNGGSTRGWLLGIDTNNSGDNPNFGGLIGDIADDCRLNITLYNNANGANVVSEGNAGLYCGTLGEEAELTITVGAGSSNTDYSVTSGASTTDPNTELVTAYNAGTIVGEMKEGSALTISGASISATTSRNINASGYAGGLVGKAVNAAFVYDLSYTITEHISGDLGAGGIAGYYCCNENNTFNLANANINCTLTSQNAGGLFGVLETQQTPAAVEGDDPTPVTFSIAGSENAIPTFTSTAAQPANGYYGGLIGTYKTDTLENTLSVSYIKTATKNSGSADGYFAGCIGKIDETQAAYVEFQSVEVAGIGSKSQFAGLICDAANNGSFINVKNFKLTGNEISGSAIANTIGTGVIRLEGTTDISAAKINWAQLVNKRGNALIYALGNGNDSGWTYLRRSTSDSNYGHDDIGNWGEVVRISSANETIQNSTVTNENRTATDLYMTFDKTAHTVTVAGSPSGGAITSTSDFVRTALNMQINQGNLGALQFTDTSKGTELLDDAFSINGDCFTLAVWHLKNKRNEVAFRVVCLADYAAFISTASVEVTE